MKTISIISKGRDVQFTTKSVTIDGKEYLYTHINELRHSEEKRVYGFRCDGEVCMLPYEEKDAQVLKAIFSQVEQLHSKAAKVTPKPVAPKATEALQEAPVAEPAATVETTIQPEPAVEPIPQGEPEFITPAAVEAPEVAPAPEHPGEPELSAQEKKKAERQARKEEKQREKEQRKAEKEEAKRRRQEEKEEARRLKQEQKEEARKAREAKKSGATAAEESPEEISGDVTAEAQTPVSSETPVVEEKPVSENAPVSEETPIGKEAPVVTETPAADEAVAEAPAAVEAQAVEEAHEDTLSYADIDDKTGPTRRSARFRRSIIIFLIVIACLAIAAVVEYKVIGPADDPQIGINSPEDSTEYNDIDDMINDLEE